MITGFFLQIFLTLIMFFVGLLPVVAFPSQITSAIATVWGAVNAFSFIFPVGTLLTVLGIAMTFHLTMIGWNFANYIARWIRGR